MRLIAISMIVCLVGGCGNPLDDRVTREEWYSPVSMPKYRKLTTEQRTTFTIYRNHIVRLNSGSADGLPDDITWKQAIAGGEALRAREAEAVATLAAALRDPNVRVRKVVIGRSNAVCGQIVYPRPPQQGRVFIVLPGNEAETSPSEEEWVANREAAMERWVNVNAMLRECEADTSALPRSSAPDNNVVAGATAAPTGPSELPAKRQAAMDAGQRGDLAALREIVAARSDDLLEYYARPFNDNAGPVDPSVERILLVAAEQAHEPANWPLVLPSWPRCTYRFTNEAMRAALVDSARRSPHALGAAQLLCSKLDVDDDAIALLGSVKEYYALGTLIRYAGARKLARAVPAIVAVQDEAARQRQSIGNAVDAYLALLAIGTPDSLSAFRKRVAALSARRDALASSEARYLLEGLARVERDPAVDIATIVPVWAAFPQADTRSAFAEWVVSWNVKEGVPLLMRSLEENGQSYLADKILRVGGPAEWKRLDAWARNTENGRAAPSYVREQIAAAAADPARASAEQAKRERSDAYSRAAGDRLNEQALRTARRGDPAEYVKLARERIERNVAASRAFPDVPQAAERVRDLAARYAELAGYARYVARDPATAVAMYERASDAARNDVAKLGFDPYQLAIADTMRFDMKDPSGAAARLRKLHDSMDSGPVAKVVRPWIDAEARFLAGERSVAAGDGFCMVAGWWFRGGGLPGVRDEPVEKLKPPMRDKDSRAAGSELDSLPPSVFHLYASFPLWPALGTPERLVAFGKRHDPSGASLACAMRLVQFLAHFRAEHPDETDRRRNLPSWSDAEFALVTNAAAQVVGPPPAMPVADPALATPAGTWNTYIAALRRGDVAAANACMTHEMRGKISGLFDRMGKDELTAIADSFTRFELFSTSGSISEGYVTRNGRAGIVTFMKQGKEWLIAQM